MRSVDTYEVLVIEDNIYYIRYYPEGIEGSRGIDMRLSENQMENFITGKIEV